VRSLKTLLGLSAAVALVLTFVLSGVASATTLCKTNTTPCTSLLSTGTVLKSNLAAASKSTFDPPFGTIECSKSPLSGTTTTNGGFVPVTANTETLSFTECNATVTVLKKGTLSINHNSGGMSGSVVQSGSEVTVQYLGTHCIYGTNNTTIGTLIPSTSLGGGFYHNAELRVGAYIPRTGGTSGAFCGSFAYWEATYLFTAPVPLYVSNI